MSSREVMPKNKASEDLPSKTMTVSHKIWYRQFKVWIGLSVAITILFLIFKSLAPSFTQKEDIVENKSVISSQGNESQISQVILPQVETSFSSQSQKSAENIVDKSSDSSISEQSSVASQTQTDISYQLNPNEISFNKSDADSQSSNLRQISILENKVKILADRLKEEENQKNLKFQIWKHCQNLKDVLNESKNFETELEQFSSLFQPQAKIHETLHILAPYAKEGLPSSNQLLQKFTSVKQEFMKMSKSQETRWYKLRWQLMPWIQIYNTQTTDPTSISLWTLSKLEKAVTAQDINQIIEITKPIKQDNLPFFNAWCEQIKNYRYLNEVKKDLLNLVIDEIVQSSISKTIIEN